MGADSEVHKPAKPRTWRSAWSIIASAFVLIFIVYPLSIGPAYWLMDRHAIPTKTMAALYYPIDELACRSQSAEQILRWYLESVWGHTSYDHYLPLNRLLRVKP
jgi:hypothetical protein